MSRKVCATTKLSKNKTQYLFLVITKIF